jgi:hypothetical protein
VGCLTDTAFPPPQLVFFTENQHSWVTFPIGAMSHEKQPTQAELLALMAQLRGA